MPSDVLDAVRKMVAAAADDRTPEGERNNKAIKACKLIADHKLLDNARPTGIDAGEVLKFVDELFSRGETIADRLRDMRRGGSRVGGRRRYRR
jgi:hypothetical protein